MIKIIEHGAFYEEPAPPVFYKCKCYFCNCIFSFNTDNTEIDYTMLDIFGKHQRIIDCPECGKTNRSYFWERIDD